MGRGVVVVGAGLAGLVAASELLDAGHRVVIVEQENFANLGAQAYWSFGGLFLVDSPEQRRLGVRDSHHLAWQDWLRTAGFDRREDYWPERWAQAYVDFAAGEKREWLRSLGVRFFPVVGWAERGGYGALGPGNTVPRFHIVWGTGPGLLEPFVRRVRDAVRFGRAEIRFRHRVTELMSEQGRISGVSGEVLAASNSPRGQASNREVTADFQIGAEAVVIASGGIGANIDMVRRWWPDRLGAPPQHMLSGVPAHVDGEMLETAEAAGADLINRDRMWHYTEGITNHSPVWHEHGIRILPGPSALWLDGNGQRLPPPLFPGFDTLGTLAHLRGSGHDHSWFITSSEVVAREFALSGSEQNPDLTGRDMGLLAERLRAGAPGPVQAFLDHGADFVTANDLTTLVDKMNDLSPQAPLSHDRVGAELAAHDWELSNTFGKDLQLAAVQRARTYAGDRLIRVARPHSLLDGSGGPLVGVKLHLLTRKTLGGIATDLDGRVLRSDGSSLPGLFAAGEAAGFGGGGMHGYRSLEGTFLGGCLFSGRQAGRGAAQLLAG